MLFTYSLYAFSEGIRPAEVWGCSRYPISSRSDITFRIVAEERDISGFFDGVDMEDGAKIIGHLLGSKTSSATKKVSKSSGASAKNTEKILAAAAPLLMSLLGQETKKSTKKKSSKSDNAELIGTVVSAVLENVDVGEVLTDLLTDKDEKKTTKKKSTTKKSTAAKKSTAKKTTSTKKKTTTKKKAADDGFGLDDAAGLLINLLK